MSGSTGTSRAARGSIAWVVSTDLTRASTFTRPYHICRTNGKLTVGGFTCRLQGRCRPMATLGECLGPRPEGGPGSQLLYYGPKKKYRPQAQRRNIIVPTKWQERSTVRILPLSLLLTGGAPHVFHRSSPIRRAACLASFPEPGLHAK
jgi:hypothetical protein